MKHKFSLLNSAWCIVHSALNSALCIQHSALRLALLFILMPGVGEVWGTTFTPGKDNTSTVKDGITISMSNTAGSGGYYQTFANSDMVVTSTSGNITSIVVTCTASGTNKYGPGNFSGTGYSASSGTTGTWTGSAASVTLSASAQVRMTEIVVTVQASEPHTVTLYRDGAQYGSILEETSAGSGVTLPSLDDCGDYEFEGWSETNTTGGSIQPTIIASGLYKPSQDVSLFAVYSQTEEGEPTSTIYTLNGNWTTNNGNWTKIEGSDLSSSLASGKYGLNSGSSTATSPKSYFQISSISVGASKSSKGSGTVEVWSGAGDNWTSLGSKNIGSSLSWSPSPNVNGDLKVKLTQSSGNVYIASITVSYSTGSAIYTSSPECTPPATTYDVKFYTDNGETQYGETQKVVENGFATAPATNPEKVGYTFSGWSESFGGEVVTVGNIAITANKNFYAKWTCATPSIKTDLSTTEVVYNQNDEATALTVAANETFSLAYQWQSKVGEGDWNNISGATEASYTPSTLTAGSTYYRCIIKNKVDQCSSTVTSSAAYITVNAVTCNNYTFHYGTDGQSDWENICFSGTEEDRTIANFVMPNKPNYYVGWAGAWQKDDPNNYSVMAAFASDLKFTNSFKDDKSTGTATGASAGAIGTLHVANSWGCCNKRLSFDPDGYKFIYGLEGQTWSSLNLTANNTVWMSDDVVLTADMLNGNIKYYVGINANNADGYAFTTNSNTVGMNTMGVYVNGAWIKDGQIGSLYAAGDKGKLRMWSDNFDAKNWSCHFVPYWTLKFDANGKDGVSVPETIEKFSELEESQRTIDVSTLVPTNIPEHFTFAGWYTDATGGTKIEKNYVMNSHATLYAHWTEDTKYTVKWYVNGVETKSADYYVYTAYSTVKVDAPAVDDKAIETCANKFMGWATKAISSQTGVEEGNVEWVNEESTITAATNYYAVFATEADGGTPKFLKYEAVTTAPADWSGTYVMVDEDNYIVARDGNKTTQMIGVSGFVTTTEFADNEITVAKTSNGYSMFYKNGSYYLGLTADDNKLHLNATYTASTFDWILSTEKITSYAYDSRYIRMSGTKVACYKSTIDGCTDLKLFKRIESSSKSYSNYLTNCCTPLAAPTNVEVTEITSTTANLKWDAVENATGYECSFNGKDWTPTTANPQSLSLSSGTAYSVKVRATYTTDDTYCEKGTASAAVPFKTNFLITKSEMSNGSVTVKVGDDEVSDAAAGATVTLVDNPATGYILETLTYNGNDVKGAKSFEMPSEDVTIAATFKSQYSKTLTFVNKLEGVTGTMPAIAFEYNLDKVLPACVWSKTGYTFEGWATTDGGAKVYDDKATIPANTFSDNANLYAVWSQKTYTIKLSDRGEVTTVDGTFHYGDLFDAFPTIQTCTGYEAFGWTDEAPTSEAWASAPAKVVSYTVQDVAEKTFYAVYREAGEPVLTNNYKLIGSSELKSGENYLIVAKGSSNYYAVNNTFTDAKYNNFGIDQVTPSNNIVVGTNDTKWQISGNSTSGYTIYNAAKNKYMTVNYDLDVDFLEGSDNAEYWTLDFPYESTTGSKQISIYSSILATGDYSYLGLYDNTDFETSSSIKENYLYKQQTEPGYNYLANPTCKVLSSVEILYNPDKVNYKAGENFDKTGLVLQANFEGGDEEAIEGDDIKIDGGDNLQMSATKVTAKYTYDGVTKSCDVDINMIELKSIAVNSASAHKTTYKIGQTFNPAGLKLDAHYNTTGSTLAQDVVELVTSGFTYSPTTALAEGTQEITITYGGKEVKFNVTVEQASAAKVTFKASSKSTYVETETSAGAGVKVPSVNDCDDYTFLGWTAEDISSELTEQPTLITIISGRYYPEEDVILYPVYQGYDDATKFKRAQSIDDLKNGSQVIIYSPSGSKFIGAGNDAPYAGYVLSEDGNGYIYSSTDAMKWTIEKPTATTYKFKNDNKYLGAASLPTSNAKGSNSVDLTYSTSNNVWSISTYSSSNQDYVPAYKLTQSSSVEDCSNFFNYYGGWKIFCTSTTTTSNAVAMRLYVPAGSVIYTSAPATCTVAIEKSDVILNAGTGFVAPDVFEVLKNESITLPDATFSCAGGTDWSFYGWATESVYPATATAPAKVNKTYTPTEDVELFAVYQKSGKYISTPSCLQVPTFSHEAGEYDEKVMLTLTAGDNSDIYYTTDGSCPIDASGNPTEKAEAYTSAGIELTSKATIAAIAVYTAGQSDMVSAAYTFVYPENPEFNVAAGNVYINSSVTITSAAGTNVYYKIDEGDFVNAGTNSYTYTFTTLGDVSITAKAEKGGLYSGEVAQVYTVKNVARTIYLNAGKGSFSDGQTKTLVEENHGDGVTLVAPDNLPYANDKWTFFGWAAASVETTTDKPTVNKAGTTYTPTADGETLYAVYRKISGLKYLLVEDFNSATSGNTTSSSGSNISWDVDGVFDKDCCTNLYEAGQAIRLGKSGEIGMLTTKSLNNAEGDNIAISFSLKGWPSNAAEISVGITGKDAVTKKTESYDFESKSLQFENVPANAVVTFSTTSDYKRDFLDNIVIATGTQTTRYATNPAQDGAYVRLNGNGAAVPFAGVKIGTDETIVLPTPVTSVEGAEFNGWISNNLTYQPGDLISGSTTDAEFAADYQLTMADEADITINKAFTLSDIVVKNGAKLTLGNSGSLNVTGDLIIETSMADKNTSGEGTEAKSAQIINAGNRITADNVYVDVVLTPSGVAEAGWYAFAVPFEVDVRNGVYGYTSGAWKQLTLEKDYAIMDYQGDVRATGAYGWIKTAKHASVLQPGVFYLVTVSDTDFGKLRFKKTTGTKVNNGKSTINLEEYSSSTDTDAGWNGIANPALTYNNAAQANATDQAPKKAVVYYHGTNSFNAIELNGTSFVVGSPFFVQADGNSDKITLTVPSIPGELRAPMRETVSGEFNVRLGKNTDSYVDQLYLSATEDATADYQIGHDMVKSYMGEPKVAQMYINGYNQKLCDAEFQFNANNEAEFPLTITAPQAGEYQLYVNRAMTGATLYLYENGNLIWNLSQGAYTLDLNKGTNEDYTLVIKKLPNTPTNVEMQNAECTMQSVQKFILDERLVIIRDGKMYNAEGALVK